MAALPTLEQAECAILDVFKEHGTRPGESIRSIALTDLTTGKGGQQFSADILNAAINSMNDKGWIDSVTRNGFYVLKDPGFDKIAVLPTLEQAERAILDVFKEHGTRPGESIRSIALTDLTTGKGEHQFRTDDINAAISSMHDKDWIDAAVQNGFYVLLDAGFEQV